MTNKRELGRQILHLIIGLSTVFFIYIGLFDPLVLFLLIIIGVLSSFIITIGGKVPVFYWFLRKFEREQQIITFPGMGMIFFFVGCLLALKLFPQDIALAAIMILTLGDSTSHIVGRYLGKIKNPLNNNGYKLLEGSIAGLVVAFAGALIFVNPFEALAAAFFAMLIEAVELELNKRVIDDNLLIPLVAGTAMLAVRHNWLIKLAEFIASFWVF